MEYEKSSKFIKYLLYLQILIVLGVGICEVLQLAAINKSQQEIIQHPNDWNYLFGYTNRLLIVVSRIYYWLVIFISLGILGWSLDSFEKRRKDVNNNYSKNSINVTLLMLWCLAIIPSIAFFSVSGRLRTCTGSTYSYAVSQRLLHHCNSYLASLILACILVFTFIIQLLLNFAIIKHNKEIDVTPPPNLQEPVKPQVKRSKHVKKKRSSLRSSSAYSAGSRLSIVTEDEEYGWNNKNNRNGSIISNKSDRSVKSLTNVQDIEKKENKFSSEMQVISNV